MERVLSFMRIPILKEIYTSEKKAWDRHNLVHYMLEINRKGAAIESKTP